MRKFIIRAVLVPAMLAAGALSAILAWPEPLFAHSATGGQIIFWSDRPIDKTAARRIGTEITRRLSSTPFALETRKRTLYIAHTRWRWLLLRNVIASKDAGGFAAYPVAENHAFLSGADFPRGLLVKSGRRIRPPRTLAYYATHELVHVRMGQILGPMRFHTMPDWIREGIPDYIAIRPRADFGALRKAITRLGNTYRLWSRHGYYAAYRLRVQHFIDNEGWSLERLMNSDMTFDAATRRMNTFHGKG